MDQDDIDALYAQAPALDAKIKQFSALCSNSSGAVLPYIGTVRDCDAWDPYFILLLNTLEILTRRRQWFEILRLWLAILMVQGKQLTFGALGKSPNICIYLYMDTEFTTTLKFEVTGRSLHRI